MVIKELETMTDDELLEVYRKESIRSYFKKENQSKLIDVLSEVLSRRKTVDLNKVNDLIDSEILWNEIKALESAPDPVALAYLKGIPNMKLGDKFDPDFMKSQTNGTSKKKKKIKDTGTPILDDTDPATRKIHKLMSNMGSMGYATVYGESMIGADLHDGDIVFYNTTKKPRSNDIVVVMLDGNVYTKRYKKILGKVILKSENELFEDIDITEFNEVKVLGVVTAKLKFDIK